MSEQEKTDTGAEEKTYSTLNDFASGGNGEAAGDGEYIPSGDTGSESPELGAAELAALYQMSFAMIAERRGEHWNVTAADAGNLGRATDAVIQKYAPGFKTGPEVALVLVSFAIIVPRMMIDKQRAAEAEAETDGD